ncbi:MAG TPA: VOC family protein [Anditalea sp.]|nr:VOC family protein [Anditalea sp.]
MKQPIPQFRGGMNIALKIPKHVYEQTISFYRDVLGFELSKEESDFFPECYSCQYGQIKLWFDRLDSYAQTDVWMDLETDDIASAREYLKSHRVPFRNELEKLPPDYKADWISNPAGVVMLLKEEKTFNTSSKN